MIALETRKDRHLAVFGLGASGRAAAAALLEGGARVTAWDDDAAARRAAASEGIALADLAAADWSRIDALVLAPGVPLTHPVPHPVAARARAAARPIIGDIELLWEACPEARFVGVTGTNGKSTTTALIGHILAAAGLEAQIGGNIGVPALALSPLGRGGTYVLELSSYQLDLTQRACFDIAVLLNVSPDHLDRHGDMEGYAAAKMRIFRDGRTEPTAIIGVDDASGVRVRDALARRGGWRVVPVSWGQQVGPGVHVADGVLVDATLEGARARPTCDLRSIDTLPGKHNWQNAAAAWAAARACGVAPAAIAGALARFPGLPHRQERVATIGGVRYVNDSKATNADAAGRALVCYDSIYWIAGGTAKAGGISTLLGELGRVRHAFLIGEAAPLFAEQIGGRCPVTMAGDLEAALRAAHALAQRERIADAVVLLSPACASFDQFANFAARGDAFRAQVRAIAAEEAA